MLLRKYWRLVTDMKAASHLALETEEDRGLVAELCGLKLMQAAREFEALLRNMENREDDLK